MPAGQTITISMLPLIYESLKKHCENTISGTLETGSTVPLAKNAAKLMLAKLNEYERYLNSRLCKLAVGLDPSILNIDDEIPTLKSEIRRILRTDYGVEPQQTQPADLHNMGLLAAAKISHSGCFHSSDDFDEVEDFFDVMKRVDSTCNDALVWWSSSQKRFPNLSIA